MKISTILFFCLLMTACMQTKSFHRINGWYYVTSQITDSLSQTPFLTVKDFDSLRLETDAFGHSVITGVFLQDKLPIWREATTKSVGKYIAFVFGKSSVRCPLKPKRFYPLKIFNNAPSKSLDRWGYYYFSLFPSVCRHLPDTFSV